MQKSKSKRGPDEMTKYFQFDCFLLVIPFLEFVGTQTFKHFTGSAEKFFLVFTVTLTTLIENYKSETSLSSNRIIFLVHHNMP